MLGRVGLWTAHLDQVPWSRGREIVQEVEALGYSALWFPEAVGRDAVVLRDGALGDELVGRLDMLQSREVARDVRVVEVAVGRGPLPVDDGEGEGVGSARAVTAAERPTQQARFRYLIMDFIVLI